MPEGSRRPPDWEALLRAHPFFAAAPPDAFEELRSRCLVRRVSAGTVLFREGDPARGMVLVGHGAVRVYRALPDGREVEVHWCGPGDSFAELPLLDGGPYPASALAVADSELLVVPVGAFTEIVRRHPAWAASLIRLLGTRLRELVERVRLLSIPRIPTRVASWLWTEVQRRGGPLAGQVIPLRRRQEDLAARLGTTRESVARALATLERAGAIRRRRGGCEIVDPAALRDAASRM